ncbi:hypothetical protein PIB30_059635 [Stylosanthes scabra]|uniref:Uncharacterized protein n=1 Tax=Stylosanthes scabra TaxID=79078 RepID=A0ABU6XLA6_9FABA|nr:hypothetical protein [Stylosanthes scabra]
MPLCRRWLLFLCSKRRRGDIEEDSVAVGFPSLTPASYSTTTNLLRCRCSLKPPFGFPFSPGRGKFYST